MALIICSECGKEISDKAASCPNCGCPINIQQKKEEKHTYFNGAEQKAAQQNTIVQSSPIVVNNAAPNKKKGSCLKTILITIGILFILGTIGNIFGRNKDSQKSETQKKNKETESIDNLTFEDEMKEFSSGEYLYITNEDLSTYCANMEGAKVYVVTDIDKIKDTVIQSTLSGGYMMSNFNISENFEKYEFCLKEDDLVAIFGTVSGYTDYKFMGRSVNLDDCKVFATGNDASSYKKENSDEELVSYFVNTEEVANLNSDISEDDYKDLCESLGYEDILRNPDTYNGKNCVISGKVDQIIEGWFDSYTIFVSDSSGNKWGCVYKYEEGESHLLEGDNITVYGECKGTENTKTVLGKQVTLPRIDVKYIN